MLYRDGFPLQTARLTLRMPRFEDLYAIAEMHADARVTRFISSWTRDQSAYFLGRIIQKLELGGVDFVVIEETATNAFVGMAGLLQMAARFREPLGEPPGLIEVGYRLAASQWGKGYATESARELLRYGFDVLKLPRITAIANVLNGASNHILKKIGLRFERTFHACDIDIHFYSQERIVP